MGRPPPFGAAAALVMSEDADAVLVHCCVTDPLAGRRRLHAWNEVRDPYDGWLVLDRSRGDAVMARAFYRALNGVRPRECRRYTGRAEVAAMRDRHGGDGPWEIDGAACARGGR